MLNNRQIKDSEECERMDNNGESMDCMDCSCSGCLAHDINDTDNSMSVIKFINLFNGSNQNNKIFTDNIKYIYTHGDCGRFAKILKTLFNTAIPYLIHDTIKIGRVV